MGQRPAVQRSFGQRPTGQRNISQRPAVQRGISQRPAGLRSVGQQPTVQRGIDQRSTRQRGVGQSAVARSGGHVRGGTVRSASRLSIEGRNYSVRRGSYRVHRHGGWRTFAALSALGGLAVGGVNYYPYAYISAPAPYCDGMTEDGCQLQWQELQTLEGAVEFQCVAYCPWQ
jgi:hypothetical protein